MSYNVTGRVLVQPAWNRFPLCDGRCQFSLTGTLSIQHLGLIGSVPVALYLLLKVNWDSFLEQDTHSQKWTPRHINDGLTRVLQISNYNYGNQHCLNYTGYIGSPQIV